ncbi:hypothetical protein [Ferroacidibacillus organovorans]|uniref:Uncharacterized protein n=1 Tax=Ferroacidibacillus organovorans TaxID=1765683 RepID=A0A101XSL0_9BACL|nr:hypothetical protein [Ferroacidibacillus organovorans]KUO96763.1 hypothetical protein ATW55_08045 [Ferroacidibacillus organovorans]
MERHDERGFALPVSLGILLVAAVITATSVYLATAASKQTALEWQAMQAKDTARSGIAVALSQLKAGKKILQQRILFQDGNADVVESPNATSTIYDLLSVSQTVYGASATVFATYNQAIQRIILIQETP